MFGNNPYPYGGYPQQPVIFIPSPGSNVPPGLTPQTAAEQIMAWKQVEKMIQGEKKDDKKKDEEKGPNIVSVILLMILVAPITGPIMSKFFSMGLSMLPQLPTVPH